MPCPNDEIVASVISLFTNPGVKTIESNVRYRRHPSNDTHPKNTFYKSEEDSAPRIKWTTERRGSKVLAGLRG